MADSKISSLSSATTPLSGTELCVIVQSSTTVQATVQDIANLSSSTNIANSDLTVSSSGIRKLTLGGALSTDGFATRNSADTFNTFETLGDGQFAVRQDAGGNYIQYDSSKKLVHSATGGRIEQTAGLYPHTLSTAGALANGTRTAANAFTIWQNGNFVFGNNSGIQTGNGKWNILLEAGTSPTTNVANHAYMFSKDIVAGNTAMHFRSENGDEQKIYSISGWGTPTGTLTRTTFATSTVTLSELAERVAALISDLKTGHQLLKA